MPEEPYIECCVCLVKVYDPMKIYPVGWGNPDVPWTDIDYMCMKCAWEWMPREFAMHLLVEEEKRVGLKELLADRKCN